MIFLIHCISNNYCLILVNPFLLQLLNLDLFETWVRNNILLHIISISKDILGLFSISFVFLKWKISILSIPYWIHQFNLKILISIYIGIIIYKINIFTIIYTIFSIGFWKFVQIITPCNQKQWNIVYNLGLKWYMCYKSANFKICRKYLKIELRLFINKSIKIAQFNT